MDRADDTELRALAATYAKAIDRRDAALLLDVFHPDGVLRVFNPSDAAEPSSERRGHEALAKIPSLVARYTRTFHFIGNATYDIDGDGAAGEVYCLAHHLTTGDDAATDYVMFIRYHDEYRRDQGGRWKIAERRLLLDWTELRAVDPNHP